MEGHRKRLAVLLAVAAALSAVVVTSAIAHSVKSGAGTLNIYGYGPGDDVQENRAKYAAGVLSSTNVNRPAGDFNDQVFLARLASGDVPDLVRMSRPRVAQYASKGVLQPMDSCVKSVKKQYRAGAMNAMTYKGHVYGLPEFTNQITLIVNQSAFKDAGVPLSAAQTKNKKALLATAKKLTKMNGSGDLTRIGFDPKIPEFFPLWVKWFGDDIISKNGLKAQLNTPHAKQALAYAVSIVNAEGGWNKFKSFRDTFDFFGRQNPLVKDQLGFWPMESFIYNVFSNNSPDVDLQAKFFQNRKGGPITYFSGNAWVVPKGSKNKADACAYMKAVTSVNAWLTAAKTREAARKASHSTFTGLYTGNSVADAKIFNDVYQSFGHPQFDKAVQTLVHASKYGFELPANPGGQQFVDAYTNAINRVLAGQQSVSAALNQAQKEAQTAINANK
ncbi:MAG: extracellular solute-binding protein [Gaiellaceae bacterium]|jgi:multiple sugar transport system substrate-binding protein